MTSQKGNIGKYWVNTKGYWQNKKRDAHTLKRLSESKFKKIAEYDAKGNLRKIWDSAKEIGNKVFDDYEVVNGGSKSRIYDILKYRIIDNKFQENSYWFRVSELIEMFGEVPSKINIDKMREEERQVRGNSYRKMMKRRTHVKRYSVLHYDNDGKLINKYNSTKHAAYMLKTSEMTVKRICMGKTKNPIFNLKYGEKTHQPINESYPDYELMQHPRPSNRKHRKKTRTKYTVIQLDQYGNKMKVYDSVEDAANKLKIKESMVRTLCLNKKDYLIHNGKKISLKYGDKKQKTI